MSELTYFGLCLAVMSVMVVAMARIDARSLGIAMRKTAIAVIAIMALIAMEWIHSITLA